MEEKFILAVRNIPKIYDMSLCTGADSELEWIREDRYTVYKSILFLVHL